MLPEGKWPRKLGDRDLPVLGAEGCAVGLESQSFLDWLHEVCDSAGRQTVGALGFFPAPRIVTIFGLDLASQG